MKTIIFDLKNTLADNDGVIESTIRQVVLRLASVDEINLYTMCEPWSFGVINDNADFFAVFTKIILVKKKKLTDLAEFVAKCDDIVVIGDGVGEEITFARQLKYRSVLVTSPAVLVARLKAEGDLI